MSRSILAPGHSIMNSSRIHVGNGPPISARGTHSFLNIPHGYPNVTMPRVSLAGQRLMRLLRPPAGLPLAAFVLTLCGVGLLPHIAGLSALAQTPPGKKIVSGAAPAPATPPPPATNPGDTTPQVQRPKLV